MKWGNEGFKSDIILKLPQLVPIMKEIEGIGFLAEISNLSKLIDYMFNNTQATNISLNNIIMYTLDNCILRTIEAKRGFILLLNNEILSPAFSLSRLIFELWATACFVEDSVQDFLNLRDESRFEKIAIKLSSGTRYPATLPWSTPSTEHPVHIKDMIKALARRRPEANITYDFLCEYCHPNYLFSAYMLRAGSLEDLWRNPKFFENISSAFEKQFSAIAESLLGIRESAKKISDMCLDEYGIR